MSKLIKQIYDLVQLATDKGITGYWSDTQIMDAVDQGQMLFFRQCLEKHLVDKRVRNILLPFQHIAPLNPSPTTGAVELPANFEHEIEVYVTVAGVQYSVHPEEVGFFRQRVNDPVDPPTTITPIYCIYGESDYRYIKISPYINIIQLLYFKRPTKPVFATDLVNDQPVYSDDDSTDVQFSPLYHDILVKNALMILGVGIRDGVLMRVGAPSEPIESRI